MNPEQIPQFDAAPVTWAEFLKHCGKGTTVALDILRRAELAVVAQLVSGRPTPRAELGDSLNRIEADFFWSPDLPSAEALWNVLARLAGAELFAPLGDQPLKSETCYHALRRNRIPVPGILLLMDALVLGWPDWSAAYCCRLLRGISEAGEDYNSLHAVVAMLLLTRSNREPARLAATLPGREQAAQAGTRTNQAPSITPNKTPKEITERDLILQTLKDTGGNLLETAKRLGMGRLTLRNKLEAYNIEAPIQDMADAVDRVAPRRTPPRPIPKVKAVAKPPAGILADDRTRFEDGLRHSEDCDRIDGGHGVFGSATNPIPVNGPQGELEYLAKLRSKTGRPVMFHRVGSTTSAVNRHTLDIFEIVAADGSQWSVLLLDMYHPRQSKLAPPDFTLRTGGLGLSRLGQLGYGVTQRVDDFPYGLPRALQERRTQGDFFAIDRAGQVERWLGETDFRAVARQLGGRPQAEPEVIKVGGADAATAATFQRLQISECHGIEGRDWKVKSLSLANDRRTLIWQVTLQSGGEKEIRFDISHVSDSGAYEGMRLFDLLIPVIEQTSETEKARLARGLPEMTPAPPPPKLAE